MLPQWRMDIEAFYKYPLTKNAFGLSHVIHRRPGVSAVTRRRWVSDCKQSLDFFTKLLPEKI